jgi:hypothetical protein
VQFFSHPGVDFLWQGWYTYIIKRGTKEREVAKMKNYRVTVVTDILVMGFPVTASTTERAAGMALEQAICQCGVDLDEVKEIKVENL